MNEIVLYRVQHSTLVNYCTANCKFGTSLLCILATLIQYFQQEEGRIDGIPLCSDILRKINVISESWRFTVSFLQIYKEEF